jgi:mono/diheme cytochrome c family protein
MNFTGDVMRFGGGCAVTRVFRFLSYFTLLASLYGCLGGRSSSSNAGLCPELRNTEYAPAAIAAKNNPLQHNAQNLGAGESLYEGELKSVSCDTCHGSGGAGNGSLASQFATPPRNFTCAKTMHGLSDGQLFWIIKNGSVDTSMQAYDRLSDEQIWQLVMYVRSFAPLAGESGAVAQK